MSRTIRRSWNRSGAYVFTVHPQYGEIRRGRITATRTGDPQARGHWTVVDQDAVDVDVIVGDYLDAEARLLDATAWADELDEGEQCAHEDADGVVCGADLSDGEGYDGLCGTHADQAEAVGAWD